MKTEKYVTPIVEMYLIRVPYSIMSASDGAVADKLIEEDDDFDWEDIF